MQLRAKRRLHPRRLGFGPFGALDDSPEGLVEYMNSRHGRPGFDRVERVVNAMNYLDRLAQSVEYTGRTCWAIAKGKFGREAQQQHRVVDQFEREYRVVVGLGAPRPQGWIRLYRYFPDTYSRSSKIRKTYVGGVFILEAAFQGFLRLLSQCPTCEKWLVLRRGHHRFCSGKCREKAFRDSDEGRAKRARYMRQYRERLNRRDAENLRVSRKAKR
jgi:hypothetical protein